MQALRPPIPTFTADWFTSTAAQGSGSWLVHVAPRLSRICDPKVQSVSWLEVGSHEGRSALWTAANLLRGDEAKIVCVDPWTHGPNGSEPLFDQNTRHDARILKMRGTSRQVLPLLRNHSFHGIYVDGLHDEATVLHDAQEVPRLLAPGGIVIFDDYEAHEPTWGVKPAVDKFLGYMRDRIDVVYRGWQLIAQLRSCSS